MSGAMNDYNQEEGEPRIRIGNWVEERALMGVAGQSRGSFTATKNDTATRITGPVYEQRDYGTTTNLAHEAMLVAPQGPKFAESVGAPRRALSREAARQQLAAQIVQEQRQAVFQNQEAAIRAQQYGGRAPQNRARALVDPSGRTLQQSAAENPLEGAAISFHTHHIATTTGTTPQRGVHTFSRDTTFSRPIYEDTKELKTR